MSFITSVPSELSREVIVKLSKVTFRDGPLTLHIICDDVVVSEQMLSFHSPSDRAWDPRHLTNDIWLVIDSFLLWMHLLS